MVPRINSREDADVVRRNELLGKQFEVARKDLGWSQAYLAERAGPCVGVLKKIEAGDSAEIHSYQMFARALGMRLSLDSAPERARADDLTERELERRLLEFLWAKMAKSRADGDRALGAAGWYLCEQDWRGRTVERRQFILGVLAVFGVSDSISHLFASDRCPPLTADDVRAMAVTCGEQLGRRDAAVGGGTVADVARLMHQQVMTWLHEGTYPSNVTRELEALSGDLGAWVCYLNLDAGNVPLAYRYITETVLHADLIEHRPAKIRALETMCRLQNRIGSPARALRAVEAALRVAEHDDIPRVKALLHMRAARARASLGDARGYEAQLVSATREIERGPCERDPFWVAWLTAEKLAALGGLGHLELGQPGQATRVLLPVTEDPDPARPCGNIYYEVQLGHAAALQGDATWAAEIGLGVLDKVGTLSSDWIQRDYLHLRNYLQRIPAASPQVREFLTAYDEAASRHAMSHVS